MPLSVGDKLGHYEVVSLLGVGGMGEVYRAKDTKLKRDVAIKVLPEAFARDPERMARFQREAEVLASLNHPNIAIIHGVEDRALVMELVEGDSPKGPLPFDEAWKIASQIVAALEYAHERGIMHRDLKPANIKVTPEGTVKLLDFGLAKAFTNQKESSASPEHSPTLTLGATEVGVILGTAAYMAPEQARGKAVDKRADIWSFAVVLHELLTGERLFTGEDAAETLAAVINKQPDLAKVPRQARRLLEECLQKDPKQRLRDIGDAKRLLVRDSDAAAAIASAVPASPRVGWLWPGVAAIFALAAMALGLVAYRHTTEEPPRVTRTFVLPPEKGTFLGTSIPAVSPDGRHLAFVATADGKQELWVRDLDSLVARPLPGTEGAINPFWSPDSRSVAFFTVGKLKKIEIAGGPALTLCDIPSQGRGGSWSKNDLIVFAINAASGLLRVPAAGGSATPVTELDRASGDGTHRFPWFLPDGRHFLYTALNGAAEKIAVDVADVDAKSGSKNRQRVLAANSMAVYAPSGYLLFVRERTLMAQPFDAAKLQTTGDAVPIAEQIDAGTGITTQYQFSVSQNGVLAYLSGGGSGGSRLTWFDRQGKVVNTVGEPAPYGPVALSPDGTRVAVHRLDGQSDLWLIEFARGTSTRFTFDPGTDYQAVWSPDGSQIVWASNRKGAFDLYRKASTGAGEEQVLLASSDTKNPQDWSPDGRFLLYTAAQKGAVNLWLLPLKEDGAAAGPPTPYLSTPFVERSAKFSPDGHWIAYASDESGKYEVYVRPFPLPAGGGGKWQISTGGGYQPLWRHDGKELLYFSQDSKLMSVDVTTNPSFKAANPKPLFAAPLTTLATSFTHTWGIAPDGQRFLLNVEAENTGSAPMTVVLNWQAGLKK